MKNKAKLTWAYNPKLNRFVYIDDEDKNNTINCICPKCKERLIPKNNIPNEKIKRVHHFAHRKDSDCEGYYETIVHELSKQIIADNLKICVPAYKKDCARTISFISVEIEKRNDSTNLQPDCVGITAEGIRYAIEIFNTHKIDDKKIKKIKEAELNCIEIKVTGKTLEELNFFYLNHQKIENGFITLHIKSSI